jgi:mannose-6-phosphate isomerase-like protein (cupin superfamily)
MSQIFPEPVVNLPEADTPLPGVKAFLAQGATYQILFMEFAEDLDLSEHSHAAQWGVVLKGRIDLVMGGVKSTFAKGDNYYIPAGTPHSGKIYAGYADMTFFDQNDRYARRMTING